MKYYYIVNRQTLIQFNKLKNDDTVKCHQSSANCRYDNFRNIEICEALNFCDKKNYGK
jgi:hypothetical protein